MLFFVFIMVSNYVLKTVILWLVVWLASIQFELLADP